MSDDINKQIILAMKRSVEDAAKPREPKAEPKRVRQASKPTVSNVSKTEETQEAQD